MTTTAIPSGRPHWLDDSPAACAYRRAELMAAVKDFDTSWKDTDRERRARDRRAWLENIEELLPEETLKVRIRVNPDGSRTLSWED